MSKRVTQKPYHAEPTELFLNLTPRHMEAIGHVAVIWSYLERNMEFLLWGLAGIDPENANHFTHLMSLQKRVDTIKALALVKLKVTEQKKLSDLIENIYELRDKRNEVVHALWVPTFNKSDAAHGLKLKILKPRKMPNGTTRFVPKSFNYTAEEIKDLSVRIRQCQNDICDFALAHNVWPYS